MSRKVTETTSNNRNDESSSSHDLERATETSPFYSNKTVTTTACEIACAGTIIIIRLTLWFFCGSCFGWCYFYVD